MSWQQVSNRAGSIRHCLAPSAVMRTGYERTDVVDLTLRRRVDALGCLESWPLVPMTATFTMVEATQDDPAHPERKEIMNTVYRLGALSAAALLSCQLYGAVNHEFYGYIKVDTSYDTDRSNHGNRAFFLLPEPSVEKDDDEFTITANQTRLGVKLNAGGPSKVLRSAARSRPTSMRVAPRPSHAYACAMPLSTCKKMA